MWSVRTRKATSCLCDECICLLATASILSERSGVECLACAARLCCTDNTPSSMRLLRTETDSLTKALSCDTAVSLACSSSCMRRSMADAHAGAPAFSVPPVPSTPTPSTPATGDSFMERHRYSSLIPQRFCLVHGWGHGEPCRGAKSARKNTMHKAVSRLSSLKIGSWSRSR